jgi:hypothetical protein
MGLQLVGRNRGGTYRYCSGKYVSFRVVCVCVYVRLRVRGSGCWPTEDVRTVRAERLPDRTRPCVSWRSLVL